jgi:hypothetical protein
MVEGNKRKIEFPDGNYCSNLKDGFNGEITNGALLQDYLALWVLSLDFVPNSKDCIHVDYGDCEFKV